jgi:hypothetical protein
MEFVIRKLAQNQIGEQDATSQAQGKSEKVDEGVTFVFEKVSQRDDEVAVEHGFAPVNSYQCSVFSLLKTDY